MSNNTTGAAKKIIFSRWGALFLAILLLAVGLGTWIFQQSAGERGVRELLEHRAQALQQKDLELYMSCFSPDYQSGERTYNVLKADAAQWFKNFVTIQFLFQIIDIQIIDDTAIVENNYTFLVTNAEGETIKISQRELLEMRHRGGEWKILKSHDIQT